LNRTDWTWKTTSKGKTRKNKRSSQNYDNLTWKPLGTNRFRRTPLKRQSGENTVEEHKIKIIRENHYKCGFCNGTGEHPPGFTCPLCKGRAENRINPPAVICACCHGTGRQKLRSSLTCIACKGKGVVSIKEPVEICSKCQGKGKMPGNDTLPCISCKGAGVVSTRDMWKRSMRKPGGSEGEVAEAIYQLEGEASIDEIARRVRLSTIYTEYICKSMLDKGYLEKLSARIYALTPECEEAIAMKEARDIEKITDEEKEILRIVRDEGEISVTKVAQKLEMSDFKIVERLCLKMADADLLDLLTSGKLVLNTKGEKILQPEERYNWR